MVVIVYVQLYKRLAKINPDFVNVNNKDKDQPALPHSLISVFVLHSG